MFYFRCLPHCLENVSVISPYERAMLEVQCISFLIWSVNELRSSVLKIDQQHSRLNSKNNELCGTKPKHSLLYSKEFDAKNPELAFELLQLARFPLIFIGLLFGDHRAYEISFLSSSGIFAMMQTLLRILGMLNCFIIFLLFCCLFFISTVAYIGSYILY